MKIKPAVYLLASILVVAATVAAVSILNKTGADDETTATDAPITPAETSVETIPSEPSLETTVTETVAPTSTPEPTSAPEPQFISDLSAYAPGDVIDSSLIDTSDLAQYFTISEINEGDSVYQRIYGQSYVDNNDIALSDLRYLKMLHVNFDGCYQVGEMIVNASVAQEVTDIFVQLCASGYEIYSMYLIDDFWAGNGTDSDSNSIDHNNTSCFCYRPASGSSHISRHALGLAIDINPQQNPYVRVQNDGSLTWSHENASDYVYDRSSSTPHVITQEDYAYQLFTSGGWTWGGSWNNPIDYQHFQK